MPNLIVIRLHPHEPVVVDSATGSGFSEYLNGLEIEAFELSFDDSAGQAAGASIGKANYIAPTLPPQFGTNPVPGQDPANRITQHFSLASVPVPVGSPAMFNRIYTAVATAVIQVPDRLPGQEHSTADIRLELRRAGGQIVHRQRYFNVPLVAGAIPGNPNAFIGLPATSLHLALKPPASIGGSSVDVLPEDGSPPTYANLRAAVEEVLNNEPGNLVQLSELDRVKSKHVAYEIIWNRQAYPLPIPKQPLEIIYTDPNSDLEERDRRVFEGDLLTYYTQHNAEADRLANYVYSLSAAVWGEKQTTLATRAGFSVPAVLAQPSGQAVVNLEMNAGGPLIPEFLVPAAYLYGLSAVLPMQISREQRFDMARLQSPGQTLGAIEAALEAQIISEDPTITPINRHQATRRLRALGLGDATDLPTFKMTFPSNAENLVTAWLDHGAPTLDAFWPALTPAQVSGHLEIVLCAVTRNHAPLIAKVKLPPLNVDAADDLPTITNSQWQALLEPSPAVGADDLLPEFTKPGTRVSRTQAFIRYLRRFFEVPSAVPDVPPPEAIAASQLARPLNPVDQLLAGYPAFMFSSWNQAQLAAVVSTIFPGDVQAQEDFIAWLQCIQDLLQLTQGIAPDEMQFSVMEALWARGLAGTASLESLTKEEFVAALAGTVALDFADLIWTNADVDDVDDDTDHSSFAPLNPDGKIVNCIPPAHRSPLGPVAYLAQLLRTAPESTCADPIPEGVKIRLGDLVAQRRGRLFDLDASSANLGVELPLIDLVNESLEYMVANNTDIGVVYNTSSDEAGGHILTSHPTPPGGAPLHDSVTLLEALPEHSSPAVPTKSQAAYDKLKLEFLGCGLPYHQPLDVSRTYLEQLGTRRFSTMRRFRRAITEFVLAPEAEPTDFPNHQWRYPVRLQTAIEYLCLTPEEYAFWFQNPIAVTTREARRQRPGEQPSLLHRHFGVSDAEAANRDEPWTDRVLRLEMFLKVMCLSYCEFLELWKSGFVRFRTGGEGPAEFPDCEPCCLEPYTIRFLEPRDAAQALKRLVVFVNLWRKLRCVPGAGYSFTELADICMVLELFDGNDVNPDFIRQLAAFQMLRDEFQLPLSDVGAITPGATGADRLHLLAFWQPGATRFSWAVEQLLLKIQTYAQRRHGCGCREPEFIKLLESNLAEISSLAGFDPNQPAYIWNAKPTHTLRFAEVLAKLYASDFGVGEILFLFTSADHLRGDDPFPLQTSNEAADCAFDLPDDVAEHSLASLRQKLLGVDVTDEQASAWTWSRMRDTLASEFGYQPPAGTDPWLSFGRHFFPNTLAGEGLSTTTVERQYVASLLTTSAPMWNTPPNGPFQYDAAAKELWTQLPLLDGEVLSKLARIRQLTNEEQAAVRELYYAPRLELARFAFLFGDFAAAELALIQEPEESRRWAHMQRSFALFRERCRVIAEHLTCHVADTIGQSGSRETGQAHELLKRLWADENQGTTAWEDDSGQPPTARTWHPQPAGGAYAALLGLQGTGVLAEYSNSGTGLLWRTMHGGLEGFGAEANQFNSPLPVVLPEMSTKLTADQLRFATIRNGFVLSNSQGELLGGGDPFSFVWSGLVLIDDGGNYGFSAGAPTPLGAAADFASIAETHQWRVSLSRGQKTWILLAHDWPAEDAPGHCSKPISLKKGFYHLRVEVRQKALEIDSLPCPRTTGFQIKYQGPDSGQSWLTIPFSRLFQARHTPLLIPNSSIAVNSVRDYLTTRYTSSVRDIRRTYQRAFKALLLVKRLDLSSVPQADDGQSELGYLLSNPDRFSGLAVYESGGVWVSHRAWLDMNFLPVLDNYVPPTAAEDQRAAPSTQRQQALFDWWERLVDAVRLRTEAHCTPERPAWLLYHEATETHEDHPAHLLRHLGIDVRHDSVVLNYFDPDEPGDVYAVTSDDLRDERWAARVWEAEKWVLRLKQRFAIRDIAEAKVHAWVSDGPDLAGNENLTWFYRVGLIENGPPARYQDLKRVNDCLRERARRALVTYLTTGNRVSLPWGGHALTAKDLSALLLLDVEAGLCQKASRIEEATTAVNLLVQRVRLGLEQTFPVTAEFLKAWDSYFITYRHWEDCQRRRIYRENWIEWDELRKAQGSEAMQFLQDQLRRAALTVPVPGGLTYFAAPRPPAHPGLKLLQHREPATIQLLTPPPEGLGLMGVPDRQARPNWLSPMLAPSQHLPDPRDPQDPPDPRRPTDDILVLTHRATTDPRVEHARSEGKLPLWFEAAMRLGTRFLRIAAASIPPSSTTLSPHCQGAPESGCCCACGQTHPPLLDEYYFWLEDAVGYAPPEQIAEWGATADDPQSDWHRETKLPGLLHWPAGPAVMLRWCRVHNGEFQAPRTSDRPVNMAPGVQATLKFLGRAGDSLTFEVVGGVAPVGVPAPPPPPPAASAPQPGFRYDLAVDAAVVLPEVVTNPLPPQVGGLTAFPFFAWHEQGAPLLPVSQFSVGYSVAGHLRAHCRYEAALKWYELVHLPLQRDNAWIRCEQDGRPDPITRREPCCCPSQPVTASRARRRSITLAYLETLVQWVDALMRQNTPESMYRARTIADMAERILGPIPVTLRGNPADEDKPTPLSQFVPDCAPLNPRWLCLATAVADRLSLIHACMNASRLRSGRSDVDMPYHGDLKVRECWKTPGSCEVPDPCHTRSCYRFEFLIGKAIELANEVRSLGSALVAAYRDGDNEALAAMRAAHERQALNLALDIRQLQWRDADWQVQALRKTKEIAETNLNYFRDLLNRGLISEEAQHEPLTIASTTSRTAGNVAVAIGQFMNLVPDPFVGFPISFIKLPPGQKLSNISMGAGTIANTVADILATMAALGLTNAGWIRRAEEWQHQIDVFTIEVEQIERLILGAERRKDVALHEINNHRQLMANAEEVHDFVRDKFTNHALSLWLQRETAALHYRMYELAWHVANQAQMAFNYERGHTSRNFLPAGGLDNLHEALLAGEQLGYSLRQMETAYRDAHCREYELVKHVSLRLHFPDAFLQLKLTGTCDLELPEWLFDLDYPGHYLRRIKTVSLTMPCVVGPYTGIHCRLTLLSSFTRVDPRLVPVQRGCCAEEKPQGLGPSECCRCETARHDGKYNLAAGQCGCSGSCRCDGGCGGSCACAHCPDETSGYVAGPEDPRVVRQYAATQAIATSTGQRDGGLFELSFRDERYLPFEFAGAVSRWRIELPQENNRFDMSSLSDCVMHVSYTAREGGENLRRAASALAQDRMARRGVRLFDLRHELPEALGLFTTDHCGPRTFPVRLRPSMFPFVPGGRSLTIKRWRLAVESPCAKPGRFLVLRYQPPEDAPCCSGPDGECKQREVLCVASDEWPCWYYGALDIDLPLACGDELVDLGTFSAPESVGAISRAYLIADYELSEACCCP